MNKLRIVMVLKGSLNYLPPVLSACKILSALEHDVTILCDSMEDKTKDELNKLGIKTVILKQNRIFPTKIGTIIRWLKFRKKAWKEIEKNTGDLYWICSADTALALGKRLLDLPYVLQIHELYDTSPYYKKNLREYTRNAKKVFVPEEVRAHIFRAWYQLKETPVVLPNKPYDHPRQKDLYISEQNARSAFEKIPEGSKVVFYQGVVNAERNVLPIAKAIEEMGHPWVMAVQCPVRNNEYYKELLNTKSVYLIPFVPAPLHLEITSHMYIGIVLYAHSHMNNEFCAPNKIWEYSGFGLPMIANDVLGLKNTLERYNAGISLNLETESVESICNVLHEIDNHYKQFSDNSDRMYNSIDNKEIIRKCLLEL